MKYPALFTFSVRIAVAAAMLSAQLLPASDLRTSSPAVDLLIQKARSLEARDRDDLAAQVWQQVLVTNPNQPDALAGLARWAKRSGKNDEANTYLGKLRRLAPDSPALTELDSLDSARKGSSRLDEARRLATAQHFDEAMRIYREVFGPNPPAGGWAIAYYETLANTPGGYEQAVAALRNLASTYPDVPDYKIAAGRLMTYRPATRQAGVALLSSVAGSSMNVAKARQAWRQALLWEKSNAAYAASVSAYLNRYNDPELEAAVTEMRAQGGKAEPQGPASREEQLGYQALKSGNLPEAERQFSDALRKDSASKQAHAGLGFARMKGGDFDGAVQQLEAAHKASPNDATIRNSLDSAKFWQAMRLGSKAADEQDWTSATRHYHDALTLRPGDAEALRAMGGSLLAMGYAEKAIPALEQAVRKQPSMESAWCALVQAKLLVGGGKAALETIRSAPSSAAAALRDNVDWKALQSAAYADEGNDAEARKIYRELVSSEHPNLPADSQVQLASLALRLHEPASALQYAQKAVESAPNKPGVWEIYVSSLVAARRPQEAERAYSRMPEQAQKIARNHPDFQDTLASLKESNGDPDGARAILEKVLDTPDIITGEHTKTSLRIHLAQLLAKLGRTTEAETLIVAVTESRPQDVNGWRAHLQILQSLHRNNDIVAVAKRMPQSVAVHLGSEGDIVNLLASAHSASGDPAFGIKLLETYIARTNDPAGTLPQKIQLGWVLLNSPGESGRLYQLLDQLNARSDLNSDQRKEVSNLWATWILRTADAARKAGNTARALALLEQGASMFPGNADLQRGLAGNLLAAGSTKRAFNVYANWGLSDAQPDDYAGAIGAALAENNAQYADGWIDRALAQWPTNPKLLTLAGDRAKSRGDLKKAELLWKEALAQKQAQASDPQLASVEASPSSLKGLLVGPDGAPKSSRPVAALLLGDSAPAVHLSSFQPNGAPREDFVRTNALLADEGTPSAAGSSFLTKSLLGTPSPVDSLQDKIASLESRNSPYLASKMTVWGRGGQNGFSRLVVQQSEFEASTTLANQMRASLLLKPTYLSTGAADGSGDALFGRQSTPTALGAQNAGGIAAEAQLSSQSLGFRVGTTPQGFLTRNWVGGFRLQPANGPITLLLERDSVKDTMLSYAGARDPGSNQTWGGVIANNASLLGRWGDDKSGIYASGGYQTLQGRQVARNTAVNGNLGTWWKVAVLPSGSLTVGMTVSAMHYARTLRYFTFGQGGYFSPQQYFLFSVPVRWTGSYGRRLQYTVGGSLGSQHFSEDASDYYPTDARLQADSRKQYPAFASTGANFSFDGRLSYQMAPHWMLGAFATANNARNYTAGSAGLFVKYTFEERPMSFENAVPSVPDWRGQQPFTLF